MPIIENLKALFRNESKTVKERGYNRFPLISNIEKRENLPIDSVKNTISQYAKYVVEVPKFYTFWEFYQAFPEVETPVNRVAKRVASLGGKIQDKDGYYKEDIQKDLDSKINLKQLIEGFVTDLLVYGQAVPVLFETEGKKTIQFVPSHEVTFWEAKKFSINKFIWYWETEVLTIDSDFKIYKFPSINSKYFGKSPLNSFYSVLNALNLDTQNFNQFLENNSFTGLAIYPKENLDKEGLNVLTESVKALNRPENRYKAGVYDGVEKMEQIKQDLQFRLTEEEKDRIASYVANAVGYPYTFLKRTSTGLGQGEQKSILLNYKDETIKPLQDYVSDFVNGFVFKVFGLENFQWVANGMQVETFSEIAEIGLKGFEAGVFSAYEYKTRYLDYNESEVQEDDKFRRFAKGTIIVKEGELEEGQAGAEDAEDDIQDSEQEDIATELNANDKKKAVKLVENPSLIEESLKKNNQKTIEQLKYGYKTKIIENLELTDLQKRAVNNSLDFQANSKTVHPLVNSVLGSFITNKKATDTELSQAEQLYQDLITEEEKFLEKEYLLFLLPSLLKIEDNLKAKILKFYDSIDVNGDGVISFDENRRFLDLMKVELDTYEKEVTSQYTGLVMDKLNDTSEKKAIEALEILNAENVLGAVILNETIRPKQNKYSFTEGYKSNIDAYFSNSFRRVKESLSDNISQNVKVSLAKEQARQISFNKNDYKLSLLTHPRGLFRRTIEQQAVSDGVNHFKAIVPNYKIPELNPKGMTSQVLYQIKTLQEWNKYNGVKSTVNSVGGMGLHHGDFIYYLPIRQKDLGIEKQIAKKQRNKFIKLIK